MIQRHILRILLLLASIIAFSSCKKNVPPPDPKSDLSSIVSAARDGVIGRVISVRTEPTTTPSHSAVIEARHKSEVYRFSVFCKDGVWYYDKPISMVSEGVPITAFDISREVSIIVYKFKFKR